MTRKRFYASLRFKITTGAVLVLVLILGPFSYLQYVRHRDLLLENLERSTTTMGRVITGSLQHAMLTRDFSEIQQIVDEVAQQSEIVSLVVLNKQGEIRIAPKGQGIGTRLNQQDPTCQACHRYVPEQRKGSVILEQPGGRIFRTMTPIENRLECHTCHDPRSRLNGVLLTDFSMAAVDQYLAADLRDNLLRAAAAVLVTIVMINVMMSRLVLTKLERFVQAIQLFGRGDLGQRLAMPGSDEIAELAATFNRMAEGLQAKDVENRQLYTELQRKEALRSQLLEQVIRAQEEERKRIARELHDEFAQVLTALTMSLQKAEAGVPPEMAQLKEQIARTRTLTNQTLRETQQWILDLRPTLLDDLGLVPAIRGYAESRLEPVGCQVQVNTEGSARRLPTEIETAVFRIVQEAVNNVVKHARAQHVHIRLTWQASQFSACVQDDGLGFDPEAVLRDSQSLRGVGLLGMQERAALLGGTLQVWSRIGEGTRLVLNVPIA